MVIRLGIIGLSADPQAWATMAYVAPLKGALASQYKITAIATSSPDTAKASAKAHGLPEEKAYSNPDDIANDPDVDMVVVSVKAPMHKQLTMPALKAKKEVFVEWPLGSSLQEAQEMAELAKKQGVRNYVMLQARTQPVFIKVNPCLFFVLCRRRVDVSIDLVRFRRKKWCSPASLVALPQPRCWVVIAS